MDVVVIGSGLVGAALGPLLRSAGHRVTGTTTTPSKADGLRAVFDEVVVLRGSDADRVARLVTGNDAVVVTAGPAPARAMTALDRAASYHDVLVRTARSVVDAGGGAHLVMLSSLSVYGRGDQGDGITIDEDTPTTADEDPSPVNFVAAERTYLAGAADRTCVLRCADISGPADLSLADKVRWAHEQLGGSVPFSADALFYRVHLDDVAACCRWAVEGRVTGVFNLVADQPVEPNGVVFDRVAASLGLAPLHCRGEIAGPVLAVSTRLLAAAGFSAGRAVEHS